MCNNENVETGLRPCLKETQQGCNYDKNEKRDKGGTLSLRIHKNNWKQKELSIAVSWKLRIENWKLIIDKRRGDPVCPAENDNRQMVIDN